MKRSQNPISPFIILLIPVLVIIGLFAINPANEEETERIEATACYFKVPSLKGVIQVLF